jgi:4-amino-4-deoxy-L-arabinose transferase-like glycosyltransferase
MFTNDAKLFSFMGIRWSSRWMEPAVHCPLSAIDLSPRTIPTERLNPEPLAATGRSRPPAPKTTLLCFLFLAWLITYAGGMFQPGLLDDADSVHAEAAREMVLRHDGVTLYINGFRYLEKAPLMYWGIASSFKALGVHDWSARLPLVFAVGALIASTFVFGRRFFGDMGGFYAALAIATGPGIYIYTRFLIPDVFVALWIELSLFCFLAGYELKNPPRWACWGLAVTVALNVLTKGLIGLVFVGLTILTFLWILRDVRYLKKMRLLSSTLVFFLIAAPWHALAAIRNPAQPGTPQKGFLWEYFVNEHFLRYLNQRTPHDYNKVPLLIFWALTIAWLIPWSAFLIPALRQIPVKWRVLRDRLDPRGRANLLLFIWAGTVILFFSFSTRQEYYTLPALPALALLIGGWLECEPEDTEAKQAGLRVATGLFVVGIISFAIAETLFFWSKPLPAGTSISDILIDHPGTYTLSLGHLRDLTLQSLSIFRAPLWEIGVFLLAGTGANWWLRRRSSLYKGNLALGAMMLGVLFCVHQGYVIFSPELSSKPLAMAIKQRYEPGEIIVLNGEYAWGSTVNFYTGIQLHLLNSKRTDLWFGSLFTDAPKIFEDVASFTQLWDGDRRVYLFTKEFNKKPALSQIDPSSVYLVARQGNKMVLTNRPIFGAGKDSAEIPDDRNLATFSAPVCDRHKRAISDRDAGKPIAAPH